MHSQSTIPLGFCQCGCGQRTTVVYGRPRSFVQFHHHRVRTPRVVPPSDRFWALVQKTDACWLWRGHTTPGDYGRFWTGGRHIVAHRWAYEQVVGPIPSGLFLDHLCRTRLCVRPDHLEPVTHQENMRRGMRAQQTHCIHGHPLTPENTYRVKSRPGSRPCRTCNITHAREQTARRRRNHE